MPAFEYWRHNRSGEIYAVRLDAGELTGIVGPVHWREVKDHALGDFEFDRQAEDIPWAIEHLDDFGWYGDPCDKEINHGNLA